MWVESALRELVIYLKRDLNENCLIGLTLNSSDFSQGETWMYYRPVTQFNFEYLWDLFSRVTQSNKNFKIDDSFKIV